MTATQRSRTSSPPPGQTEPAAAPRTRTRSHTKSAAAKLADAEVIGEAHVFATATSGAISTRGSIPAIEPSTTTTTATTAHTQPTHTSDLDTGLRHRRQRTPSVPVDPDLDFEHLESSAGSSPSTLASTPAPPSPSPIAGFGSGPSSGPTSRSGSGSTGLSPAPASITSHEHEHDPPASSAWTSCIRPLSHPSCARTPAGGDNSDSDGDGSDNSANDLAGKNGRDETTSTSCQQCPTTDNAETNNNNKRAMLSGKTALRGRNMEDMGDLEEQGLLMRREVSDSAVGAGTPRQRNVTEKDTRDNVQFEKIELDDGGEKMVGAGLKSKRDQQAFALLVVLYLLQGIPLGLTFGTLPFLLKPHLSYSALAVFALSTWPYSLKLLWSPIVDAWFVPKWGRRKSWIVPVQAIVGVGLWIIGGRVESWLAADTIDIHFITMVFGSLIFAAATQDIAVDGWALTLLSPPNLSYASTAQTIGLGIGTALSFTVFLALNSVDFTNKYFRSTPGLTPLIELGSYMRFWGMMYLVVTAWLVFFKTEDPVSADDPDLDVGKVYKVMWSIIRLKNIQSFLFILLIAKFGFQVNESVTQLKLLEKGLSKEDLAVAVLLDFPAQMIVGWLAAKWSRPAQPSGDEGRHPLSAANTRAAAAAGVLRVWIGAFWARLIMATIAAVVVYNYPTGQKVGGSYFALIIATTLMTSLTNTVQFVGITAFHTQIADPLIGGTYMTLLNTVSNLGGTWPKPIILRAVDMLTVSHCSATGNECTTEQGKAACNAVNGSCVVTRDGYYVMDAICVVLSVTLLMVHILPTIKRLQSLPMSAWRVKIPV